MKGTISICRTNSNRRDAFVTIEAVSYSTSPASKIQITLEVADFGQALLGLAGQPCEALVRGTWEKAEGE